MTESTLKLTLASASPYKKAVLNKLGIAFEAVSPDIDETPLQNESPEELVTRLARLKALKVWQELSLQKESGQPHYMIGIDQVAVHNNEVLGKPGTRDKAIQQLLRFSNGEVTFLTGICLLTGPDSFEVSVEPYKVCFKNLTKLQITAYIDAESPLDCAGSFKCEGQGILLFSAMQGRDPNSLIGMPLITLQEQFMRFGVDLFDYIGPV